MAGIKRLACGLRVSLPFVCWMKIVLKIILMTDWIVCGESVWIRGAYRLLYTFARIFRLRSVFLAWTTAISNYRGSWICWLRGRLDGNCASEMEATLIPENIPLTALMTSLRRGHWLGGPFSRKVNRQSDPGRKASYLVDPASSYMLVSKIKPCMSKYKRTYTVKLQMAH